MKETTANLINRYICSGLKIICFFPESRLPWLPALILLCILSGCNSSRDEDSQKKAHPPLSNADFPAIESGDIILKQGRGRLSGMIVKKLNEKVPISHCGILVKDKDSVYVIHSVAEELTGIDGVQTVDFKTFLGDCVRGCIYVVRYRGNEAEREQIAQTARHYLQQRATFDYNINYHDSDRVNCSELVYWTLPAHKREKLFRKIRVQDKSPLAFNSLLDTANFRIIYAY